MEGLIWIAQILAFLIIVRYSLRVYSRNVLLSLEGIPLIMAYAFAGGVNVFGLFFQTEDWFTKESLIASLFFFAFYSGTRLIFTIRKKTFKPRYSPTYVSLRLIMIFYLINLTPLNNYFQWLKLAVPVLLVLNVINSKISLELRIINLSILVIEFIRLSSGYYKEPLFLIIIFIALGIIMYRGNNAIILKVFGLLLCLTASIYSIQLISARRSSINQNQIESSGSYVKEFLVNRVTEIELSRRYVVSLNSQETSFRLGLSQDIIGQCLWTWIPSLIWPGKPPVENAIMERVYNLGIVSRLSNVSAKPQLIVDGYVFGGLLGIFILSALWIRGWLTIVSFGGEYLGNVRCSSELILVSTLSLSKVHTLSLFLTDLFSVLLFFVFVKILRYLWKF